MPPPQLRIVEPMLALVCLGASILLLVDLLEVGGHINQLFGIRVTLECVAIAIVVVAFDALPRGSTPTDGSDKPPGSDPG
jgi:hypothetical protein